MTGAERAVRNDSFWSGPIRTERTATLTVNWAGGILTAMGCASLIAVFSSGQTLRDHVGALIVAVLLGGPGAFLFFKRSRAAAVVGFAAAIVMLLISTAIVVYIALREPAGLSVFADFILPTFWLLLCGLLWRAIRATWLLRRLERESAAADDASAAA